MNTQPSTDRLRLESLNALNGGFRNSASTSSSRLEDINGVFRSFGVSSSTSNIATNKTSLISHVTDKKELKRKEGRMILGIYIYIYLDNILEAFVI